MRWNTPRLSRSTRRGRGNLMNTPEPSLLPPEDRDCDDEWERTEADREIKRRKEEEPMSPVGELAFCVGYLKSKGVI
jgi:hypothetical protein